MTPQPPIQNEPPIEVEVPPTITPIPTDPSTPTPAPVPSPEPPTSTPYPYLLPPNLSPPTVSVFDTVPAIRGKEGFWYTPPSHRGIDVIPDGIGPDGIRLYENNNAVIGWRVLTLYAGYLFFDATDEHRAYLSIGGDIDTFRDVKYQLMYSHINPTRGEGKVDPGNEIGTIMDITFDPNYSKGIFHHLHLEIRETANKLNTFDPKFLIHPVSG